MSKRIGSYQVLEEVASGGHATVYRVWDHRTGQTMALKVMHPHLSKDPSYLQRFEREAQLASSLQHPNVVHIFEVGKVGESHFIAMEYLPMTLHHLLARQAALPMDHAVDIAYQICLGLDAAAQQGIVHRDIKPQNVLLNPDGLVKITDFGIARAQDVTTMTRSGLVMGTPQYMAPEQARGESLDIRSDLYSVGVLLYQMLTGQLPFEGDNPWDVIRRHIEESPSPVRQTHPEVPEELASVVERCLKKDPAERYQTPADLAQALGALQSSLGRPPFARLEAAFASGGMPGGPPAETTTLPAPPPPRSWRRALTSRGAIAFAVTGIASLILLFPAGGKDLIQRMFNPQESGPVAGLAGTPTPAPEPSPLPTPEPGAIQIATATSTAVPARPTPTPLPLRTPRPTEALKHLEAMGRGERLTVSLALDEADRTGISEVVVSAAQSIPGSVLAVERLPGRPTFTSPPGEVYAYLQVSLDSVPDSSIGSASIKFRVPVSWLRQSRVAVGDMALYTYKSVWERLPTVFVAQDAVSVTFVADSPGFSLFAIAGDAPPPPTPTPVPTPSPTPTRTPTPAPTPTLTPSPTPIPTPVRTADILVLNHTGVGNTTTPRFVITSTTPWKMEYRPTWSGKITVQVMTDQGTRTVAEHDVRQGTLYETFVYSVVGDMAITVQGAPRDGGWIMRATEKPTVPPPSASFGPPGTVFAYTATSKANSPSFDVSGALWLLRFQTTWSGPFTLEVVGSQAIPLVHGDVTAGVVYETFVYDITGEGLYLSATAAPASGRWAVWVVEDPRVPTVTGPAKDRGLIFTYTGTGQVNSPPFQADSAPWRLVYTTSWSGPFILNGITGARSDALVSQDVEAGTIYETYIYGLKGTIYLAVDRAPPDGAWSVSITQVPERSNVSGPGGPARAVFAHTGTGSANSPPFEVKAPGWKVVFVASWSGTLTLNVSGSTIVSQKVTAGTVYEATVKEPTGSLYFSASGVPPDGRWTVWVVENSG